MIMSMRVDSEYGVLYCSLLINRFVKVCRVLDRGLIRGIGFY